MQYKQRIPRREFLKLAGVLGAGWYLTACNGSNVSESNTPTTAKPLEKVADLEDAFDANDVVFATAGNADYDTYKGGFNARIDKQPKVIALCKNTKGVSAAIRYAAKHNLKVAVRSGGHSMEGFSSNDGGMMIYLGLMKKIEWVNDNTIKVQPGCTLNDLYNELLPKKKLLPAGSCGSVGVGGLALGGGYGFFARKYGLTCDHLKGLTLVDGAGGIHDADDELLWACRGGGNGNFGVVTAMQFELRNAPETFKAHRLRAYKLDETRATLLMQKWFEVAPTLPESAFSAFVLNGHTVLILITDYEHNEDLIMPVIEALSPLCDKKTHGNDIPVAKALKTFYGIQHPVCFKNASAGYYNGFGDIENVIGEVINTVFKTRGMIYQVNTMGGAISNTDAAEQSCYAHRGFKFLSELQVYRDKKDDFDDALEAFENVQQLFLNNGVTAQYVNYPDINFKDHNKAYYGNNLNRLKAIKQQYDPNNLITHPQAITV